MEEEARLWRAAALLRRVPPSGMRGDYFVAKIVTPHEERGYGVSMSNDTSTTSYDRLKARLAESEAREEVLKCALALQADSKNAVKQAALAGALERHDLTLGVGGAIAKALLAERPEISFSDLQKSRKEGEEARKRVDAVVKAKRAPASADTAALAKRARVTKSHREV